MRQGYVTREMAREHYGAVINAATGLADREASAALRAEMRAQGLPRDVPYTRDARPPQLTVVHDRPRRLFSKKIREIESEARVANLLPNRCC